jgi:hypothetical protein
MLSRRDLVGKLAAGTAAVCAVGVARSSFASTGSRKSGASEAAKGTAELASAAQVQPRIDVVIDGGPPQTLAAAQPWEILRPLTVGSAVAHGWRVAALSGSANGSCVLTLENERGRSHRVHICRNDGNPQGLVFTKEFDLVVMNGGAGDLPTEEGLAQAVGEVAHVLARNEHSTGALVTSLLAHNERLERYSGAEDRRLR